MKAAAAQLGIPEEEVELYQDEDVLDTWFSSALFPFAAFGWPDTDTEEFKSFYPTTLLETGKDILFFWVARMVMFGLLLTGQLPFKEIFLHSMVKDIHGRKMSKSRGNVLDPLDIINGQSLENLLQDIRDSPYIDAKEKEIAIKAKKKEFPHGIKKCGSDALRYGLLSYMVQTGDINLNVEKIEANRRMCNKVWNTIKFASQFFEDKDFAPEFSVIQVNEGKRLVHQWIMHRLNIAIDRMTKAMMGYRFGEATQAFEDFWIGDLCDFYIEAVKPVLHGKEEAWLKD